MKFPIFLSYLCSFSLLLSSCATVNEILGRDASTTTHKELQKKETHVKSKSNKRGKVSSQTSTPIKTTNTAPHSTNSFSESDSIAIVQHLSGEWYFDMVDNINVGGDDDRPSVCFESTGSRFYANNGCNYFNGTYSITGPASISFNDIIATSNFCNDIKWADNIANMWYNIIYMEFSGKGSDELLELQDNSRRCVARLKRHSSNALNGLWNVIQIDGRIIKTDNPTIAIDLIERKIHGNTGCNLINGTLYQDPDVEMSIQFQNLAATHMSCPSVAIETALLVGLEQVEKAVIENPDRVAFCDESNNPIIILERATL